MSGASDLFVRGSGAGPRRTRRRWLGPVLAGAVLVGVGLLTLQPTDTDLTYDPTSVGATGLRGVVDVLEEVGASVTVTDDPAAAADADTVLVPPLGWEPDLPRALAAGGARVVAVVPPGEDAEPSLLGVGTLGLVELEPSCALLADVEVLRALSWDAYLTDTTQETVATCLVRDGAAWLHVVPIGDGELVSLGTLAPLVNERLVDSDAGLAAVRLLAPTGDEQVVVLSEPPGAPPPTLLDVIDRRWIDAAWLTLAVLLVLALARGRRLGRPVDEALPVRVPSGELARAVGDLRHRAGHDGRAATHLREHTLALARRELGLPPSAGGDAVLDELRSTGVDVPAGVAEALTGALPDDGDGLVATARGLAELRLLVHDRLDDATPPPNGTP